MKDKINSYFAILIITIVGAGAMMIIVRVADSDTLLFTAIGDQATYGALQESILNE